MKTNQTNSTKWLLSTALIALLASTYSFQGLSRPAISGEISLASTDGGPSDDEAPPMPLKKSSDSVIIKPMKIEAVKIADKPLYLKSDDEFIKKDDVKKTEAAITAEGSCPTGDCKTTVTAEAPKTSLEDIVKQLQIEIMQLKEQLTSKKSEPAAESKVAAKVGPYSEECGDASADESAADKRKRLSCEKQAKLKEKQDERIAKFEDKVEDLKFKCDGDIECLSSDFADLLSRYDGRDALPANTVNKAFKNAVGTELAKALYSGDNTKLESAMSVLQNIMSNVPAEYSSVKQLTMEVVKSKAQASADKIQQSYAQLNQYSEQKNSQAYMQTLQSIQQEQPALNYLSNTYSNTIRNSLVFADDSNALNYYQRTYLPDMNKLMANIMTPQTTTTGGTTTTRQDRTSTTTVNNPNQTIWENGAPTTDVNGKMTTPNQAWQFQNTQNGVQIGNPQNSSMGGRGARVSQ